MEAAFSVVPLSWHEDADIVVGQSHFIKTVEDVAEIVAGTVPGARFGLAFCEASGPCLIRTEGNDPALIEDAVRNAQAVGAGHTFFLMLKNAYRINILPALKACPEVCRIFCATGNPVQALVAGTQQGKGIMGVIDGSSPKRVEGDKDKAERRAMLRKFGYKL